MYPSASGTRRRLVHLQHYHQLFVLVLVYSEIVSAHREIQAPWSRTRTVLHRQTQWHETAAALRSPATHDDDVRIMTQRII